MKRREFMAGLGGAAAGWPIVANAQQAAMPVIGFINSQPLEAFSEYLRGFREGLKTNGFVEGENVVLEFRSAENQNDRLPALVEELIRRRVTLIAAPGGPASAAAVKATATIPIVFAVAEDPVTLGLVASLPRPGGNATGVNFFSVELAAKRLELLHELMPAAIRIAVLINPAEATIAAANLRDVESAARRMGLQIQVARASTSNEIDAAFEAFARDRAEALFISSGPFFTSRRVHLAHQATRHALPAIHGSRLYAEAGGLISYGASVKDAYWQVGVYSGRILKGAKPADMPVVQSTKFELVINAQTAKVLRFTVPQTLLSRADELIE